MTPSTARDTTTAHRPRESRPPNELTQLFGGSRLSGCACSTTPVKVKLPTRTKATAVAAGNVYSLAIVHPA
jgi:hypothetical protein